MLEPEARVTDLLQDDVPDASCQLPSLTFTSTLLRPTLSDAIPLTVMVAVVNVCPFVGEVISMVGGVVSGVGGTYGDDTEGPEYVPEVGNRTVWSCPSSK